MGRKTLFAVLFVCFALFSFKVNGSINNSLYEIKQLIENEKYDAAIEKLKNVEQMCLSDTTEQVKKDFNLFMGAALYFTGKHENAIPYLQNALQQMSYKPDDGDCNYLETIYGIASCYNNINDYKNAESYYRKAIIINDIQPFACRIMTQIYTELIELYIKTNQHILADLCTKQFERHQLSLRSTKDNHNDWQMIVEEIFAGLPSYDKIVFEDKLKVIEAFSSILEIINSNVGKSNDEYILYCSLFANYMQYKFNDTITAKELNMQLIDIGHNLAVHKPEIASAYEDYLRLISGQNEVDLVDNILPEAIEYYRATPNKNRDEMNLYEVVGLGFCNAGYYDVGLQYLDNEYNRGNELRIASLGHLINYYYNRDPQKALSLSYKAEEQFHRIEEISSETKYMVYNDIMQLNTQFGKYHEGLEYGNKLIHLINNNHLADNTLAYVLTNCSVLYGRTKDLANAVKMFASIDSIYNNLSEEYKIYYLSNKGFIYLICDVYDKAIEYLKQSIEIAVNENGDSYFQLETIYHNLGRAYMLQQNYEEALKWLNKSRDLQMSNKGNVFENTIKYINECEKLKL